MTASVVSGPPLGCPHVTGRRLRCLGAVVAAAILCLVILAMALHPHGSPAEPSGISTQSPPSSLDVLNDMHSDG